MKTGYQIAELIIGTVALVGICLGGCVNTSSTTHLAGLDCEEADTGIKERSQNLTKREALVKRAWELCSQKKYREALTVIEDAVAKSPDNPQVTRTKAAVLLEAGQPAESENTLRPLLSAKPVDPPGHLLLAYALVAQGNDVKAVAEFRRVLILSTDHVLRISAYLGLGAICEKTGDMKAAASHYRAALALEPNLKKVLIEVQKAALQGRPMVKAGFNEAQADQIDERLKAVRHHLKTISKHDY